MKYFKHDLLSREDDKIWELIDSHGMQGYGIWWAILEELYKAEATDFQVEATDIWLKRLSRQLGLSDWLTMVRTLDRFAELNLIDRQLWRDRVIYAHGIAKRAEAYVKEREQGRLRKQRQREKEREALMMSPRTNDASRVTPGGQVASHRCVPANIDLDLNIDSDPDPEIDQDLLKSFIPECPEPSIEPLCSADALRDRAPISKTKEPEPAKQETADTFPPLDSQVEKPGAQPKPRTRKKSGGGARKISTPKNHPEQFDAAWDSYRKFCIAVESTVALSQARKEAVREWDKLIEGGDALEAILDGLNFYMEVKRVEHQRKGEAFGISHFCRFLSNRKWEAAITYREQKRSQPAPAKDITANVHADLQDITVLLRQLGRSAVLPPEWQERTGKTFTRQLDAVESDDYVAYLKGELERLAVANP
jgi:hypothetical protein